MVSLGDVRRWSPVGLDAAATAALEHHTTLVGLQDELDATARPADWLGDAAVAAAARHDELAEQLRRTAAQAAAVGRGLDEAGASVSQVWTLLSESDFLAASWSFALGDDNVVRDVLPLDTRLTEAELADRVRMHTELVDRVERVLHTAVATDADLAGVLRAAARDEVDDGTGPSLVGAADAGMAVGRLSALAPPEDGSPTQNAAWWNSLTPEPTPSNVASALTPGPARTPCARSSAIRHARSFASCSSTASTVTATVKVVVKRTVNRFTRLSSQK